MGQRVLITGISGFVGQHMARLLVDRGYEVHGLVRSAQYALPEGCHPLLADLEDPASLAPLPREWFGVVHLAGASVPSLFTTTAPVVLNLRTTLNLLEHLQAARVVLASSCHVYAPSDQVRTEEHPILPQGRYGLSKHLLEQLVPHYLQRLDLRVARPFNHLGPGQRPELVIPSLLRRLAADGPGEKSPLVMQGQDSIRDFIDVRDVVAAYLAILELEAPPAGPFNVCTGRACSVGEVVRTVLGLVGSQRDVQFTRQANSKDDIPYLVGDPSRLASASGWKARIPLAQSLADMLAAQEQTPRALP